MSWGLLGILYIVCAVMCAVGFYKFVYFLSVGYGLAVAGGGIAVLILYLTASSATPLWLVLLPSPRRLLLLRSRLLLSLQHRNLPAKARRMICRFSLFYLLKFGIKSLVFRCDVSPTASRKRACI
jgi:hypothetical protein